jgi:triphosphoribosyl-dephospho-CoA synthase
MGCEHVAHALVGACLAEIRAPKPGNVSIYAAGHGMDADDFVRSARAIAAPLTAPGSTVGERILAAVRATRAVIADNTNLGIILVCAPLAHAALRLAPRQSLKAEVSEVLNALDRRDAALAYEAIRQANPGGLGTAAYHDVREAPQVSLLEAMVEAQAWDGIARQYATGYADIFELGTPCVRQFEARWESEEWAAVSCYLGLLARAPDTHLIRKHGLEAALQVSREAARMNEMLGQAVQPEALLPQLTAWDGQLKGAALNPGTTADLTVASLFVKRLEDLRNRGCLS